MFYFYKKNQAWHVCSSIYPPGTETELVLWNHVMSLPCPVGTRLSLPFCLSYNPHHASVTSSSQGPRLRWSTKTRAGKCGRSKSAVSGLGLMGAEGVMRCSRKNFNLITNYPSPLKASVWSVPAEDMMVCVCDYVYRTCVVKISSNHLMLSRLNLILIS